VLLWNIADPSETNQEFFGKQSDKKGIGKKRQDIFFVGLLFLIMLNFFNLFLFFWGICLKE